MSLAREGASAYIINAHAAWQNLAPKLTFAWASHSDGEKEIL